MDAQRILVPSNERNMSLAETMQLASMFFKSGMFADVKSEAAAGVIILTGRELGFSAMASMLGINILFGKPSLSADLIAALIKRDRRYNFHVVVHTANECRIEFMEDGKVCHTETYTLADATTAGLIEKNPLWRKYPREFLYARCISKGGNIVCPQRLLGLDISEELSAPVEAVEATPEAAEKAVEELTGEKPVQQNGAPVPPPAPKPTQPATTQPTSSPVGQPQASPATAATKPTRPFTAEQLKAKYAEACAKCADTPTADGYRGIIAASLDLCFAGQADSTPKVHSLVKYLSGKNSRIDLTPRELRAFGSWLRQTQDSGGALHIDSWAEKEAQIVITEVMREAGQQALPLEDNEDQAPKDTEPGEEELPF